MSRLILVLDSIGYDFYKKTPTPNLDSVGDVHLAYSQGAWTVPSFASLLMGYLPVCSVDGCFHRDAIEHNPFLINEYKIKLYSTNPWVQVLFKNMGLTVIDSEDYNKVKEDDYDIIIVHVMRTHGHLVSRLEEVDRSLAGLLNRFDQILFFGDHGEYVKSPGLGHAHLDGKFHPEVLKVPIATRNWKPLRRKKLG